jgi:8-amino-7-oxononanoate synthase
MHDENVITLRTLGKAFGVEGALLGMSAVLRDFMVNRARSFIFSTAPSPFMAALAQAAIKIVATHAHLQFGQTHQLSNVPFAAPLQKTRPTYANLPCYHGQ